jgi:hexosaminidase
MEGLIFPRASAMAERLWTHPSENYHQAETRMSLHREWLVKNGIRAASIQPTFCTQNQGACYGEEEKL